jgi:hypothetical protein
MLVKESKPRRAGGEIKFRIIVPKSLRVVILQALHNHILAGHLSPENIRSGAGKLLLAEYVIGSERILLRVYPMRPNKDVSTFEKGGLQNGYGLQITFGFSVRKEKFGRHKEAPKNGNFTREHNSKISKSGLKCS